MIEAIPKDRVKEVWASPVFHHIRKTEIFRNVAIFYKLNNKTMEKIKDIYEISKILLEEKKYSKCGKVIKLSRRMIITQNSLLASSVYLGCILNGKHIPQQKIADLLGISTATMRKGIRRIVELERFKKEICAKFIIGVQR